MTQGDDLKSEIIPRTEECAEPSKHERQKPGHWASLHDGFQRRDGGFQVADFTRRHSFDDTQVRAGLGSRSSEMLTASARAAGSLAGLPGAEADDVRDKLATLLADRGAPQEARAAALDSLVALNDPGLDRALAQAVRDAGLEQSDLLDRIEKLLSERKQQLNLP